MDEILKQLIEEERKLLELVDKATIKLKAVQNTIAVYKGESIPAGSTFKAPSTAPFLAQFYPVNGTIATKIMFYLKAVNETTAKDIATYIAHQDNIQVEEERETLLRTVTMVASTLYNNGKIAARKEGVKNIYSYIRD